MLFPVLSKSLDLPTRRLPGVLLCGLLAGAAIVLGQYNWISNHGLGALTIAILLGIALGNSPWAPQQALWSDGIALSKQQFLRLGIILYGLRLTLQDVRHVGAAAILTDLLVLTSTFALTMLAGRYLFRLPARLCALIGAGSSICGAAAVMATDPVIDSKPEEVSVAVSGVVLFGSASMLLYPLVYAWSQSALGDIGAPAFGVFAGSTIHEVAQVIVAGKAVSDTAADTAVITKMVRVMMLAPFLLVLAFAWRSYRQRSTSNTSGAASQQGAPVSVPWFAFIFIAVVVLNSLISLPAPLRSALMEADNLLLAMAMAALGLTTRLQVLRQTGIRPFLLTALMWGWLMSGGLLINYLVALIV